MKIIKTFTTAAIIFIFIAFAGMQISAQTLLSSFHPVRNSAGKTSISEFSFVQNPAQFLRLRSGFVGSGYSPSRFGMQELAVSRLVCAQSFSQDIAAAADVSALTNSLYSEFNAALYGAYALTEIFRTGAGVQLSTIGIQNYPSRMSAAVHIGGILSLSDKLDAGFTLRNINRASYTDGDRNIPQEALFGFGFQVSPDIYLDADANIVFAQASGINLAMRYDFFDGLRARIAASSYPRALEAAFAAGFSSFNVVAGLHYHDVLGFSENINLAYLW